MGAQAAAFRVAADDPAIDGHFPGNPVVPGAVLLREVLHILAQHGHAAWSEIRSAKFFYPVRPGEVLILRWEVQADGDVAFNCGTDGQMTATSGRCAFSGTIRMRSG